jgi:hypothetical protein
MMKLRHGETILRTIKRHPTPYLFRLFKILIVAIPAYLILFYLGREIEGDWPLYPFAAVSFFIGIIVALVSIDYLLDRLIITSKRVVWINWKSLFKREVHEAELIDIQDIESREKGILSKLRLFDYGFIEIETAASKTCILFEDCPDPDGVKHFVLQQTEKLRGGVHEKWEPPEKEEEWSVN